MPSADPYTDAVLADAPDVYYLFDNTGAAGGHDSSGNNRDLTHISGGSGIWGTGPFTGWYSSYGDMNRTVWNPSKVSNWTFEFWIKNQSGQVYLMLMCDGSFTRGFGFEYGRTACAQPAGSPKYASSWWPGTWGCTTNTFVSDFAWHHIAFVLGAGTTWSYYLDGALIGSVTPGGTIPACSAGDVLTIGSPGIADPNRIYSRVAVYPTALSAARIAAHYAAAGPVAPPPPCQYGTRAKAVSPLVAVLQEAALVALADGLGLTWLETMILVAAGQQIDVTALCQSLPPTPPPPTPEALNYPPYKILEWVYPLIWNTYCECVPGATTPTPPPNPTWTKPPGWQDPRVIVVNPTNPCLDLTEVRRMLDTIIRQTNIDVQLDTLMQRYALPFATVRGATHSGLSGYGSFAISRLIGVQITITSRNPGRELEGAPQYVWDLGWASCLDGNGFIQERRITRDVEVWMPRSFQEATTFGYMFKEGVVASVTELQAET